MKIFRPKIAFAHDVTMAAISFPLSLFLRMGYDLLQFDPWFLVQSSVMFAVIAGAIFWSMRLYGGERADRLLGSLAVDASRIDRELGWTPPYTLDQGLHATVNWYRGATV